MNINEKKDTSLQDQCLYELWMIGQGQYHKDLKSVNPFFVIDGENQVAGMEIL